MPRQQELVRQRRQDKVIYLDILSTISTYLQYLGAARGGGQEVAAGGGLCLHARHHAEGDGAAGPESPGGG